MTDEVHVKTSNHNRYLVKSLVHASRVLEAFQSAGDVLRLRDVVTRTGFNKGMCFRLLYTLHQCGFLDKVGENHYRLASEVRRRAPEHRAPRGRTRCPVPGPRNRCG